MYIFVCSNYIICARIKSCYLCIDGWMTYWLSQIISDSCATIVMPRNQTLNEADNLFKIETWWLKKNGYLDDYKASLVERENTYTGQTERVHIAVSTSLIPEENYLKLHYGDTTQVVPLVTTPCHFGSNRYWFTCPQCNRRIAVLYKLGDTFACRLCHNLTYHSKRLNKRCWAFPYEQVIAVQKKIKALEMTMDKRTYQGIPTRKVQRLEELYRRYGDYALLMRGYPGQSFL